MIEINNKRAASLAYAILAIKYRASRIYEKMTQPFLKKLLRILCQYFWPEIYIEDEKLHLTWKKIKQMVIEKHFWL